MPGGGGSWDTDLEKIKMYMFSDENSFSLVRPGNGDGLFDGGGKMLVGVWGGSWKR